MSTPLCSWKAGTLWGMTGSLVSAGGGRMVVRRGEVKMVFFVEGRCLSCCAAGRHWVAVETLAFNVVSKTKNIKSSSHGVESYL